MRDSFIFYRSFYEAITLLDDHQKTEVILAICDLALNGKDTELEGVSGAIMTLIKPQILANNRRYENGKKGGRPNLTKTKAKPKKNQNKTKKEPNVNDNDNDNVNDNDNDNVIYSRVIDYLNARLGTHYRASSKATQKHINARVREGVTYEDFCLVIDKKADEWEHNAKMAKYLTPDTLFGTKMEKYINQPAQRNKLESYYTTIDEWEQRNGT